MSKPITVMVLVEGKAEKIFVTDLLAPELWVNMVFLDPVIVSKKGDKGGDVKFERVKNDILTHLKQRSDTYVTTMVDYYGVKEWPGVDNVPKNVTPGMIADHVRKATMNKIENKEFFPDDLQASRRFIPYMAVHEFEALLFSDSTILASELQVDKNKVDAVLSKFKEPEAVNNSRETAPSKRLGDWLGVEEFPKTTLGIQIAKEIGLRKMREQCPVFNNWLSQLENLTNITQ